MNILLIDNTMDPDCWGSPDLVRFLARDPKSAVHVRRAPHDDLPTDPKAFDRLVLSGSRTSCLSDFPWTRHLDDFVKRYLETKRPFLGVCYGHQVLCRVLGGAETLQRGSTPEFGWVKIRQREENALFEGLPKEFHSYASHYEEAKKLPPGTRNLADSERCTVQAIQWEDRPVYGIQFHPEKLEDEGNKSLEKDVKEGKKEGILGYRQSKKLYDGNVGETIFANFLKLSPGGKTK